MQKGAQCCECLRIQAFPQLRRPSEEKYLIPRQIQAFLTLDCGLDGEGSLRAFRALLLVKVSTDVKICYLLSVFFFRRTST